MSLQDDSNRHSQESNKNAEEPLHECERRGACKCAEVLDDNYLEEDSGA